MYLFEAELDEGIAHLTSSCSVPVGSCWTCLSRVPLVSLPPRSGAQKHAFPWASQHHLWYRMSLSENNSVVFAYESSVHCTNVLLSLDDQRKQDILCDVTILVEDQRFRAHKAVLAACSSYFLSRIVGQVDADLIITLPEEVSVPPFCILPASASNLLSSVPFNGRAGV